MMKLFFSITILLFLAVTNGTAKNNHPPRIVNIINFIRQLEPRDNNITEDVLYETVCEQVKLLKKYNMRGTFLLQYDALINPSYQSLLKEEMKRGTEVGGWWEITQPHVEAVGLKWRGRYPWDWHADVGFAVGYTPEEREKLVDVYMNKFKEIFGKYPASIGSWFIDAHTLRYMYEKYGIVSSCTCRDQYGTDGYTLWGGYWNQAYYPSRLNGYMPAQTKEGQIPVPVFRMLGSDPIYQYDISLGESAQGVITLEPVWEAGRNEKWVRYFFKSIFEDPCIGFNYTQVGQENSFTWAGIKNWEFNSRFSIHWHKPEIYRLRHWKKRDVGLKRNILSLLLPRSQHSLTRKTMVIGLYGSTVVSTVQICYGMIIPFVLGISTYLMNV